MKVCSYCNTTNADSVMVCMACGGNSFKNKCGNCDTGFDSGLYCPKCGVKAGTIAKKCPDCRTEYFSNACPNCGYTNRKSQVSGPATVIYNDLTTPPSYTDMISPPDKKRKTWLWVLGWIFIFPVPLTIIMLKNQKLSKALRIVIIITAWLVYIALGSSA